MSTFDTLLHLLLDPAAPPEVGSHRHPADPDYPELAAVVYLNLQATGGRVTLSGPADQLVSLLDRLRAELATLTAARHQADHAGAVRVDANTATPEADPAPTAATT